MILLVTLNSTYQHSSFGLRYIKANMKELKSFTQILEPTIQINPKNLVEKILSLKPKIVGFGIYIWNTHQTYEVISILKKISPDTIVVLGGPEITYETESQALTKLANYVIQGEADFLFYDLCKSILNDEKPSHKIISARLPNIDQINLPYFEYSDEDIKNRVIYVEASRGCPYKCEYCLSSLDKSVRTFDLDLFLKEMENLIERGARVFKFVDRTFNLSIQTSLKILNFFLIHIDKKLFLHFEMVPDRLPDELKEVLLKYPKGSLQFEVGIQTLNPDVAKNVSRKNNFEKVKANFNFLKSCGIHTHADLIVGLPQETLASFALGFDELIKMDPDEIQVGILKRLKGTPITRHDQTWEMIYQEHAPFQVLKTKTMSFEDIQKLTRFSKYWDLYANSANFKTYMSFLLNQPGSVFWNFMRFVEYLSQVYSEQHSISLVSLAESAYHFLIDDLKIPEENAIKIILDDYCYGFKKRDIPQFLKSKSNDDNLEKKHNLILRQEKHLFKNQNN